MVLTALMVPVLFPEQRQPMHRESCKIVTRTIKKMLYLSKNEDCAGTDKVPGQEKEENSAGNKWRLPPIDKKTASFATSIS